jgi:hypothetical protein
MDSLELSLSDAERLVEFTTRQSADDRNPLYSGSSKTFSISIHAGRSHAQNGG